MGEGEASSKRVTPFAVALTCIAALLLPCLYVASVGPVARYGDRPSLVGVWRVVYAPLEWAHEHTVLREPLEAYVGFWVELAPGPRD
jgi:hypothetical protein